MHDAPSGHTRLLIRVEGVVQGVTYRASARRVARELGIEAAPVNLPDGAVRIEAAGPRDALDRFIAWCHEGPPRARVTRVVVEEIS